MHVDACVDGRHFFVRLFCVLNLASYIAVVEVANLYEAVVTGAKSEWFMGTIQSYEAPTRRVNCPIVWSGGSITLALRLSPQLRGVENPL
jgi:hypothetical protein